MVAKVVLLSSFMFREKKTLGESQSSLGVDSEKGPSKRAACTGSPMRHRRAASCPCEGQVVSAVRLRPEVSVTTPHTGRCCGRSAATGAACARGGGRGRGPGQRYLWTLPLEPDVISHVTKHQSLIFFQPFENGKSVLSSQPVQKQWPTSAGHSAVCMALTFQALVWGLLRKEHCSSTLQILSHLISTVTLGGGSLFSL